jgi:2-keto-4-pentenoate hydratase/2-oxohepta-3-ene-1,7-dioic acid hydratase in catechol pathway
VRLVRIRSDADGPMPLGGIVEGDTVRVLGNAGDDPLLDLIGRHPDGEPDAAATGRSVSLGDVQLLAPLRRPGKIVAIGLNYADHTSETGLDAPDEPLTFAKYPSSIIGPDDAIVVPADVTEQVDWEAELAVVIGTTCGPERRGTLEDVYGYTVANDVSARDLQFGDKQWTRGKSIDTFCPLGPMIVTPDELDDPQALRIWATVNGETMQNGNTEDMIFDVAALLDFVTATVTLEPGDLLLTGTPPGVGGFREPPIFLADGDVVTVGVEGIGELTNPVRHIRRGASS